MSAGLAPQRRRASAGVALDVPERIRAVLVRSRVGIAVLVVSIFGAIWILGFTRAVQLRPILLTDYASQVRVGLRWRLDIPRTAIASVSFTGVNAPPKRTPGYARAALGDPNVVLTLGAPIRAYGPYGMVRDVTRVGLVIDDVKAFEQSMNVVALANQR